jgi:hypothetical protein
MMRAHRTRKKNMRFPDVFLQGLPAWVRMTPSVPARATTAGVSNDRVARRPLLKKVSLKC